MSPLFQILFRNIRLLFVGSLMLTASGCSNMTGDTVQARFNFGPVSQNLTALPDEIPAFRQESRAAALREELLAPVNRNAPNDRDWRYVRGTDHRPTILGIGLRFDLHSDQWQLRAGVQRRGSNRMFGPEFLMNFDGK